jgi:hypothetical protein
MMFSTYHHGGMPGYTPRFAYLIDFSHVASSGIQHFDAFSMEMES